MRTLSEIKTLLNASIFSMNSNNDDTNDISTSATNLTGLNFRRINYQYHPKDNILALLSFHAYEKNIIEGSTPKFGDADTQKYQIYGIEDLNDWIVLRVHSEKSEGKNCWTSSGYRGVVYENIRDKQLVISHKGTTQTNIKDILTDFHSIYRNKIGLQQKYAYEFTEKAVEEFQLRCRKKYTLTITGHSLGAWQAELSCRYCFKEFKDQLAEVDIKVVVFDSPGSLSMLESLHSNIENYESTVDLRDLNIVTYLTVPNMINNCNRRYGRVYTIYPDEIADSKNWRFANFHSDIIQRFDRNTGKPTKYEKVEDWPCLEHWTSSKLWKGGCKFDKLFLVHIKLSGKKISEETEILHNIAKMKSVHWYLDRIQKQRSNIHFLNNKVLAGKINELQSYYTIEGNEIKLKEAAVEKEITLDDIFFGTKRLLEIIKSDNEGMEQDMEDLIHGRKEKLVSDEISALVPREKFVDRRNQIEAMLVSLSAKRRVVLAGDYGTGKSTLAAEYAEQYRKQKYTIKWFDRNNIELSFRLLARELEIENSDKDPLRVVRKKVYTILKEKDRIILIFDNFNDIYNNTNLISYITEAPDNVQCIVTTNQPDQFLTINATTIKLDEFTDIEVKNYFKSNLPGITNKQSNELIKIFGRRPYILNMAVSIFNKNELLSINEFIRHCRELLSPSEPPHAPMNLLLQLWFESEIGIKGSGSDSIAVTVTDAENTKQDFLYLSYLYPDFIPLELIKAIIAKRISINGPIGRMASSRDLNNLVNTLKPLSVKVVNFAGEKGLRMHHLLQSSAKSWSSLSTGFNAEKVIKELSEIVALQLFTRDNTTDEKLSLNDLYRPHVEEILKYAKEKELVLTPPRAYLQVALGAYYDFRGHQDVAEGVLLDLQSNFVAAGVGLTEDRKNSQELLINASNSTVSSRITSLSEFDKKLPTIYAQSCYHLGRVYFSQAERVVVDPDRGRESKDRLYHQAKDCFEAAVACRVIIDKDREETYDDSFNEPVGNPLDSTIFQRSGLAVWCQFKDVSTKEDYEKAIQIYESLIKLESEKAEGVRDAFNLDTCRRQLGQCKLSLALDYTLDLETRKRLLDEGIGTLGHFLRISNLTTDNLYENADDILTTLKGKSEKDPRIGKYYNMIGEIFFFLYQLTNINNDFLKQAEAFFTATVTLEESQRDNNSNINQDANFILKKARDHLHRIEENRT